MLVFVYGTLKRGFGNHPVMETAKGVFLGNSVVEGFACVNTPWFPYAVKKAGAKISGEVYEVFEKGLAVLDNLEGYPTLYDRAKTTTSFGETWIYYSKRNLGGEIKEYGLTEEWQSR